VYSYCYFASLICGFIATSQRMHPSLLYLLILHIVLRTYCYFTSYCVLIVTSHRTAYLLLLNTHLLCTYCFFASYRVGITTSHPTAWELLLRILLRGNYYFASYCVGITTSHPFPVYPLLLHTGWTLPLCIF
jgi:hypothetical protein